MLQLFFKTCSSVIAVYSFICLIRIFMTWIPQVQNTPFAHVISGITDPYLNWFHRFSFTRIAMMDFSPILAIGILSLGSSLFATLSNAGTITLGIVLAGILNVLWSFFGFFLNFILFFLIIRLVYDFFSRYGSSQFWTMLDRLLNPLISYITRLFGRGRTMKYRTSLILTLAVTLVVRVGLGYAVMYLSRLLYSLPV